MDYIIKYWTGKESNPIEFINHFRCTTEPIGGGTEHDDDGELVNCDAAIAAISIAEKAIIEKACEWLKHQEEMIGVLFEEDFIERFKNLQTIYGSKEIRCSFYDGKIMFAIPTNGNYFEIDDASLNDTKKYIKFYEEINAIFEMIDYFKFNEKTKL